MQQSTVPAAGKTSVAALQIVVVDINERIK